MKIINISIKKFNSLTPYQICAGCINTEAQLYYFSQKNKWNNEKKIFKKFYVTTGREFSNKMFTISSLIDYKEIMNIDELVIPDCIISINSNIEGYIMKLVNGKNLSEIIYDSKIDLQTKIDLLKQLGVILDKMKKVRKYTCISDFYLGDIHEDNLMVDQNGMLKVIDLDSCKILDNISSPTRYLQNLKRKNIINQKYQLDSVISDIITPNEQTDYYCFMIILLNTLYQDNITKLDIKDFYNYLDYLTTIGINIELIDCFSDLYTNKPNQNISYLLDSIGEEGYRAHNKVFKINRQ